MDKHFTLSKALEYSNTVIKHLSSKVYCSYDEKIDEKIKQSELYKAFNNHKTECSIMKDCLAYMYLSFQRNRILHYCFKPAVLLHCIDINGHCSDKVLQKQKIKQEFIFLCELFKVEFMFDPDVSREQVISWNNLALLLETICSVQYHKLSKFYWWFFKTGTILLLFDHSHYHYTYSGYCKKQCWTQNLFLVYCRDFLDIVTHVVKIWV